MPFWYQLLSALETIVFAIFVSWNPGIGAAQAVVVLALGYFLLENFFLSLGLDYLYWNPYLLCFLVPMVMVLPKGKMIGMMNASLHRLEATRVVIFSDLQMP